MRRKRREGWRRRREMGVGDSDELGEGGTNQNRKEDDDKEERGKKKRVSG